MYIMGFCLNSKLKTPHQSSLCFIRLDLITLTLEDAMMENEELPCFSLIRKREGTTVAVIVMGNIKECSSIIIFSILSELTIPVCHLVN